MSDFQKKSDTDLQKFVTEKREELRGLRFSAAGSGVRDVKGVRNAKKDIARALTEMKRRTMEKST